LGPRPLYEFLLEIDDGARRWCHALKSTPRSIASSSLRSNRLPRLRVIAR
jgi:hypothetical protein